jgi:hypothetical protein
MPETAEVAREIEKAAEAHDAGKAAGLIDKLLAQVDLVQHSMRPNAGDTLHELAAI